MENKQLYISINKFFNVLFLIWFLIIVIFFYVGYQDMLVFEYSRISFAISNFIVFSIIMGIRIFCFFNPVEYNTQTKLDEYIKE